MTKELLAKQYELVQALKLVALPYQDQVRSLPPHVVVADEIALTYSAAYDTCKPAIEAGSMFPKNIVMILAEIDAMFSSMSDRPDLWSTQALQADHNWHAQRQRAGNALELLGEDPVGPPDLSIAYP